MFTKRALNVLPICFVLLRVHLITFLRSRTKLCVERPFNELQEYYKQITDSGTFKRKVKNNDPMLRAENVAYRTMRYIRCIAIIITLGFRLFK